MANVYDVANFFIDLAAHNEEDYMTNLRLNKLLYFAQGWSLASRGKPLFPESIEAWKYGPVIPEIYHKYKEHGKCLISEVDKNYSPDVFTDEEMDLLLDVAREYGKYTSPALVSMTHDDNGPWKKIFDQNIDGTIENDELKSYFQSLKPLNRFQDAKFEVIEGHRDSDGILVLPKELDDDWTI